uniref:Uncharacterized protein n=1 Tax=Anguilla anguilla TaxID=7936 RepID=A0A0E9X1Q8_ANGAN
MSHSTKPRVTELSRSHNTKPELQHLVSRVEVWWTQMQTWTTECRNSRRMFNSKGTQYSRQSRSQFVQRSKTRKIHRAKSTESEGKNQSR